MLSSNFHFDIFILHFRTFPQSVSARLGHKESGSNNSNNSKGEKKEIKEYNTTAAVHFLLVREFCLECSLELLTAE